MCGINGLVQFRQLRTRDELHHIVHRMNEQIAHRGPDDEGLYADEYCSFGMRRLAIIDLEGGSQPIWNDSQTLAIIFNGEIYNYRSVRDSLIAQGVQFRTNSDTEVILRGYEIYGIDVLSRIEGMFAFCIYRKAEHKWFFARDRIGEKPLYYAHNSDYFVFSSELKAIESTGMVDTRLDYIALSQFFQLTYIPAPRTIYETVSKLPAGHFLELTDDGCVNIQKYWCLQREMRIDTTLSYDIYRKKLRDALIHSVEQRMISDVPLGAFLSGGFDSSIVVSIMSMLTPGKVNTFNVAFSNRIYDESRLAQIVAKKNRTNHTTLELNEDEMIADIPVILNNMDEPFADSSLIAVYAISKMAKKYVKVVLTGDGGDELFAGYNKYLLSYYGAMYRRIPGFLRKGIIERAVSFLPSKSYKTQGIRKVISAFDLPEIEQIRYMMSLALKANELATFAPELETETLGFISEQYAYLNNADAQTRTQFVDINTVLEGDMLPKVDRGSMLASLETRIPMLDTGIVEMAFNIPTKYKIKGKNRKIILKDAFRDLLPEELYHAPKHGFGVPVSDWLETQLKGKLLSYAERDLLKAQGLFDSDFIAKVIAEHMNHRIDRFSPLWSFYVFQNWYERTIGF